MLDVKFIVERFEYVKERLLRRGEWAIESLSEVVTLYNRKKELQFKGDNLRHLQKEKGKELSKLTQSTKEYIVFREELKNISEEIKEIEREERELDEKIHEILLRIPNIPNESVPIGKDDSFNKVIRVWGEKPQFDFEPKPHWELGERLGIFDFERASKIAGSRFVVLYGVGSKLERALINFMLDFHTQKHGYKEVWPPFIVNSAAMLGTGQLPKFKEELFKIEGYEFYLVPTAEVPVTNLHAQEIIPEKLLPLKYVAYTPCFRAEAGSYGKDVRGIIRQHQFDKVELVKFVHPERSYQELELLVNDAEEILQQLGLHYRVVELCTGDLGFSAAKCYDLEVWLPSQGVYKEISSCSNFEDYQARRANIRYKGEKGKPAFVHTLNGSGLAIGRTMVAILEQYQQKDGSVIVPQVLRDYLGCEVIKAD